jgi:hypothetical protein
VLAASTTLLPAEAYIHHYWERPAKSDYDHAIHRFLRWRRLSGGDLGAMGEAALALVEGEIPARPAAPTSLPARALAKLGRAVDARVLGV